MMPAQSVWRHGSRRVSAFRSNVNYVRLDWLPSFSHSSFPRCLHMDSVHFVDLLNNAHINGSLHNRRFPAHARTLDHSPTFVTRILASGIPRTETFLTAQAHTSRSEIGCGSSRPH